MPRKFENPTNGSELRQFLIEQGAGVIHEMIYFAKHGQLKNPESDLGGMKMVWDALIPIVHESKDTINLSNLWEASPEKRGEMILEAVGTSQITVEEGAKMIDMIVKMSGGDMTPQQAVGLTIIMPDSNAQKEGVNETLVIDSTAE